MTPPLIAETATAKLPWRYQEGADVYTHIIRSGDQFVLQLSQDSRGNQEALARLIVESVNAHASLKARVAELEANERAYEAALGQRTYNEVALHIKELTEALQAMVDAKALSGVRAQVAGWNGEGRDEPYKERHPYRLGATMPKTCCGEIYELDDALRAARALTNGDAS